MLIIRDARPGDIDSLTGLLGTLFSIEADFAVNEPLQRQGLQMMLESPGGCILVAEINGRVVGMSSGQFTISTAEGGPALLVEDVVVHSQWQGQGIGRRLMEGLGSWAGQNGATRLQLLADRNNAAALEFYKRLGWQITELICLRKYER